MHSMHIKYEASAEISQKNMCIKFIFLAAIQTAIQFSFVPIAGLEVIAYLQSTSRLTG